VTEENRVRYRWVNAKGEEADYIPPSTPDELAWQLRALFGLTFPRKAVCPGHTAPFDALAEAYFAQSANVIWIASRGFGGKTHLMAGLSLMEWMDRFDVILLGGSGEQSARAHRVTSRAWSHTQTMSVCDHCNQLNFDDTENCVKCKKPLAGAKTVTFEAPSHMIAGQGEPLVTKTVSLCGNVMQALTASTKSTRGPHPQRLRMDEVDEMDIKIVDAALGQTMRVDRGRPPQVVFASTHHYESGTMSELLRRASERGWPVRRWCYKETLIDPSNPGSWLMPENIDEKRQQTTSRMWSVEYDLDRPTSEGTLFSKETLDNLFYAVGSSTEIEDRLGELCLLEDPLEEGRYVVAADWARKHDLSVLAVVRYDVTPPRLVRWVRCFRWPWPRVVKLYNDWGKEFHARAIHDATGIGDVIDAYLDIPIASMVSYVMTPASKAKLYLDYETSVSAGEVSWPALKSLVELHRTVTVDDLYGDGHPPDELCALALAWQIAGGKQTVSRMLRVRRA